MTQSSTHTIQPPQLSSQHQNEVFPQAMASQRGFELAGAPLLNMQLLMVNRERPLLEKLKAMRIEQSHLENKNKYLADENE